jgi:hypothetical protein
MRTTHLWSHGRSLLKRATKLNLNFDRNSSVHLVILTIMLLRLKDNAHGKLVVPAKLVKIGQVVTIDEQDVVQIQTESLILVRGMTHMDDQGTVRVHTVTLMKILPNLTGNNFAKPGIFMNVLTHTTSLMKDIINSIECPNDHARMPRHA